MSVWTGKVKTDLVFLVLLFLFLSSPYQAIAASISEPSNVPTERRIEESFSVGGSLSGVDAGQVYYLKCRIGSSESSLTEGQTENSGSWLSDTSAWTSMPTVTAEGASKDFTLNCRVKSGSGLGDKLVFLRGCLKESDGSCDNHFQSSSGKIIKIIESPTPTIILTNTPVPSSTITPTRGPTSTPLPTTTITNTPVPTQTPANYSNVFITEFMANPNSGNEWVELFNNNDSEINLNGWYLDDISGGGGSPRLISGTISGKSYKQFFLADFFLNNDGDEARLLDGGQNEKDKKSYTATTRGKSWSKDSSGNWCEVDSSTPGSANPTCSSATSTPTPKITGSITPTPKLTPLPSRSLTPTAEPTSLLKISSQSSQLVLGEQITSIPTKVPKAKGPFKVTASFFIVSGIILLGTSGFFLFRGKFW